MLKGDVEQIHKVDRAHYSIINFRQPYSEEHLKTDGNKPRCRTVKRAPACCTIPGKSIKSSLKCRNETQCTPTV